LIGGESPFLAGYFLYLPVSSILRGIRKAQLPVPLLLTENTTAIFLHIEPQVPGFFPALAEQGPPIPVNKGHPVLYRQGLGGLLDKAVVLVGADEQGGAEAGKTLFRPVTDGFFQPQAVTKGASAIALVKIRVNTLDKGPQAVFILHYKVQILVPGKADQGILSAPVFGKGVNIGVIPE
jgi:hypothetical protein